MFSAAENALYIRDGYNQNLDDLRCNRNQVFNWRRSVYEKLDQELANAASIILDSCPLLQNVSIEYLPQIGYLVAVTKDSEIFLHQNTLDNNFELLYANEEVLYYKHPIVLGIL